MKFYYGILENNIDVTNIVEKNFMIDNVVNIIGNDHYKSLYFTDPIKGILKSIIVRKDNKIQIFDSDIINLNIETFSDFLDDNNLFTIFISNKLTKIHSKLKLKFGNFKQEYPEQLMAISFLNGNNKVLEIGSNIGRNSLIIAFIINEDTNFVTLECNKFHYNQVLYNRDINNLNFHIENSALSKINLIQQKWKTVPSENIPKGWERINIITYNELSLKYNIKFDTLILDCEGAFYYILRDMPEIMNNINLVIMENDYTDIDHYNFIKENFINNGLTKVYSDILKNGPDKMICKDNFYEVWKK